MGEKREGVQIGFITGADNDTLIRVKTPEQVESQLGSALKTDKNTQKTIETFGFVAVPPKEQIIGPKALARDRIKDEEEVAVAESPFTPYEEVVGSQNINVRQRAEKKKRWGH